ncbi:hypothetical protein LOZ53_002149 [Ophidiomyces ophidiicola]|nr:hypothetical protein LOZ55_003784 [Ophidiomyces ophidiicola]KAI1989561.1 hypothetical protein LOZ54_002861 [Ophidiomyces ophidiicola]KAI1993381.1 hypothetical protein LOZ53_002149 [Ophidiomyces ophidiicola]KAI1995677.1 hypothetical protein LOZ51_003503 [Ophidiomyces ophidiicola]
MSLPAPPVDLVGHCSIIHNNTLYVYTPAAFLSLPLKRDAKWKTLPMGQVVEGAACVRGSVDGNPNNLGLYLVGGKSKSPDYLGLQRYSFADQKWESIIPVSKDVQNRVNHAAIYINASASLLVYAGSQAEDSNPSTQSFLISVTPPHNVRSFNSYVPPAFRPILLPWSEDKAVMVGGGPGNTKVFSFNAEQGWQDTGANLAKPLPEMSKVRCAMVLGNDGSKVLEVFDMSVSPNAVSRYTMVTPGGTPAPPGQEVGIARPKRRKRELTLASYPSYNGTFAPKTTRSEYSLAQDANGLVVISGGNKQDPIALFDQSRNSWLNTTDFFVDSVKAAQATPTPTGTSDGRTGMITDIVVPTTTGSAAAAGSNRRTLTIIGATLGALLGLAALLIIVLLLLGWKRRRGKYPSDEKSEHRLSDGDQFDFQDQGMQPLTRSVQPMARGPVPSSDSWALVTGKADDLSKPATTFDDMLTGKPSKGGSPLRNVETVPTSETKPTLGVPLPSDGSQRLTDEGWSKYFQSDTASGYNNNNYPNGLRSTTSSQDSKSDYHGTSWGGVGDFKAGPPPGREQPHPLGQVASGSPSTEHVPTFGSLAATNSMRAKISSGDSISIASDEYDFEQAVAEVGGRSTVDDRVASSTYSASLYVPHDSSSFVLPSDTDRWTRDGGESMVSNARTTGPPPLISSDISWLNLGKKR